MIMAMTCYNSIKRKYKLNGGFNIFWGDTISFIQGVLFPAKDISVKVSKWVSKLIGSITFRKSG